MIMRLSRDGTHVSMRHCWPKRKGAGEIGTHSPMMGTMIDSDAWLKREKELKME